MKKIAIAGGGAMGLALATVLSSNNSVSLWIRDRKQAKETAKKRENKKHLPGIKIPESVFISPDLSEVIEGADLVIVAVPSFNMRDVVNLLKGLLGEEVEKWPFLVGLAKGMEKKTLKLPSQIVEDIFGSIGLPYSHLAVLGFASEIARGNPTTEVLASTDPALARQIKDILETKRFHILSSDDLLGVQLGGTLKNILTMGIALAEATQKDPKIRGKLLPSAIDELVRIGTALGGTRETLNGLSGEGDLVLTSSSSLSRSYLVGRRLITEGLRPIRQEIEKRRITSEGWESVQAVYQICQERGIDAPIVTEVYKVIYEGKPAEEAAAALVDLVKRREEERKQQKKKEKDKKKDKDRDKDKHKNGKKGKDKKSGNGKNGGNARGNGGKKNGNDKNSKKVANGG
ncbi:MAG: NAD(P)H-dependent glycerol-3-phosphate dehydrogenase [Chloroflexi bacterium]|nr:NAD(P)H-dependent glycerol-3-phosphate dehydrogenase [Chloroflexota bacterium]